WGYPTRIWRLYGASGPVEPCYASRTRNAGLTVVELLVAIAIIGMLIAIALPAIQMARESSRRMRCQNNLRQLGLGFAAHEAETQFYPPGFVLKPNRHNYVQFLLPFMEQGEIQAAYDFNSDWYSK